MGYQATVINVGVVSPSDVTRERDAAVAVTYEWNASHSEANNLVFLPILWETHTAPEMGEHPQSIINRKMIARCDLLIAIFGARLGTPTASALSGTVEEIETHLAAGKLAMLYFSQAPLDRGSLNLEQFKALESFRLDCEKKGLLHYYDTVEDFKKACFKHLTLTAIQYYSEQSQRSGLSSTDRRNLSSYATQLLNKSVETTGKIFVARMMSGLVIQAGKQQMQLNNPRDEAAWMAAIKELIDLSLIEEETTLSGPGKFYSLTHAGYQMIDAQGDASPP